MTAENHSVKDSASLHQLTFHIVDSAMGAGKSESLLDRARFNGGWGYIRYPEEVERLRKAIGQLKPSEQRLFRMRYEAEMDIPQIVAATGIGERSVSAMLSTAKRKLSELYKKGGQV